MLAIYKRELQSYLHSFLGFLFIAMTLVFVGFYFVLYNVVVGYPYFYYTTSGSLFMFLILIPVITMRSLSEERKNKTDQLILTAPVTVGKVVMGKFLALVTVFAIPVAIISVYPLVLASFGTVPMGEAYLSILGFFLYGMAALAVGLFASSLTENPIIAAILSFIMLLVGYLMPSVSGTVYNEQLSAIISVFDMRTPFYKLVQGVLYLDVVVYYLTVTVLFLFFTVQSIQKRRYSVSVKTFSVSAYSSGMIVIAVIIAIAVNVIVGMMPNTWKAIDMTYEQLYTLSDETTEFVENIDEDITIFVMVNKDSEDSIVGQTLEKYDALSDHISVEYIDPTLNPKFHLQYTTESITTNSLIFVSDRRTKVLKLIELYETTLDEESGGFVKTGYDGEGQITSALAYVTMDKVSVANFVEGHGETKFSEDFKSALEKQNVMSETIDLVNYDVIPEDIDCLIINNPVRDFTDAELEKLIAFMEQGGNIVVCAGAKEMEMPNFDKLLAYMGLTLTDGTVVEEDKNMFYQTPVSLLPKLSYSKYTTGVYLKGLNVLAPLARGIIVNEEANADISYDQFMVTSDSAFAKATSDALTYEREENDVAGPFAIGVSAVKKLESGTTTMVVYSSADMFTDNVSAFVSNSNQRIFANGVSNCVGDETTISIPAKSYSLSYLTINQSQIVLIAGVVLLLLPITAVLIGLSIWVVRRRR